MPELEYSGTWMGETFVTISVKSEQPVNWQIGDYLIYRGEKFVLNYDPSVVKKARRNTYGEGFVYDGIKFNSLNVEMSDVQFLDEVLSDNHIHYTSLPNFSFFAATIDDYADRLQANMNRYCLQNNFLLSEWWLILTPSRTRTVARGAGVSGLSARLGAAWDAAYQDEPSTDGEKFNQNVSISKSTVFAGLANIYNLFGLHYVTSGRTLIIGAAGKIASHVFEYGKGKGLYEMERVADSEQQIITKLYAYGNSTNLPVRYYSNIAKVCIGKVTSLQSNETRLYIHTDVPYSEAYFTNKTGNIIPKALVTIRSHGVTIRGGVVEQNDGTVQVDVFLKTSQSDPDWYTTDSQGLATLIQQMQVGDEIIFAEGADIDKWPAGHFSYGSAIPNNLAVNNLMLPGFPTQSLKAWVLANGGMLNQDGTVTWNGHTAFFSDNELAPYILSPNSAALGVREASKTWDGSDDTEDIYPTIENTGDDILVSADIITDNGVFGDGEEVPNFSVVVKGLGDDVELDSLISNSGDAAKISMKDGYCGGREFSVVSAEKVSGSTNWKLTLKRDYDEALQLYFPYSNNASIGHTPVANEAYQLRGADIAGYDGDKFVWLGIDMPSEYIEVSAEKLLDAALTFLEANDYARYTYSPKVDEIYMAKQHDAAIASQSSQNPFDSLHDTLHEGNLMQFDDEDLMIDGNIFIDKLTIKEYGNGAIPTYDVTLRNHKSVGTYQRLLNTVDSLSGKGGASGIGGNGGVSTSQAKSLIHQEGDKRYIRRDINDETDTDLTANKFVAKEGVKTDTIGGKSGTTLRVEDDLQVDGDASVDGDAELKGDVKIGASASNKAIVNAVMQVLAQMKSQNYVDDSPLGKGGWNLLSADDNGNSYLVIDKLFVRLKAIFNELELRKISYAGGNIIFSHAGSEIVGVKPLYRNGAVYAYRCYCKKDDGTTATENWWKVDDQAKCQTFNIQEGVHQNVENTYYWRKVVAVGSERAFLDGTTSEELYNYADLSLGDCDAGSDIPKAGDSIIQMGNRTDTERQGFVSIEVYGPDAPALKVYEGVNGYTLEDKRPIIISPKNRSMRVQHYEIETDYGVFPAVKERGEWSLIDNQRCYYFDRVQHNGSSWLCTYPQGSTPKYTTEEPSVNATYWKVDAQAGESAPSYTEEWYAWSNVQSVVNATTEPTPNGGWNQVIGGQGAYAYLWKKLIRYTWNSATRVYVAGTAQYFRMSGTNGTSIDINGEVALHTDMEANGYVTPVGGTRHIADDGESYALQEDWTDSEGVNRQGHLFMWSAEGTKWIPLGKFQGEDGKTFYTHVAWATSVTTNPSTGEVTNVTGFTIAKTADDTTHLWMGVYVDENSAADPDDALLYTWSYTKGVQGNNGYNTATLFLYKRSATPISSIDWSNTLTYTFANKTLSPIPTGWSLNTIPSGTDPIYVTAATAYSNTATDSIAPNEWASPVKYVENGAQGEHGLNTASVFLYQRAASAPTKPSSALTYTFATGLLSGTLGNWSQNIPATDGNPCWVIQATAISGGTTDSITANEWSTQKKMVEDGASVSVDDANSKTQYAVSTSSTVTPSSWQDTMPTVPQGQFLWTKVTTAFTDGKSTVSYGVSYRGTDGNDVQIDTSRTYVRYSTAKTASQPADSTFTRTTPPSLSEGDYLWSLSQTAYVGVTNVLKSYSVSRLGIDGEEGRRGPDGYTTHFAYATSADGSQDFSTTNFAGATFIGTYKDDKSADSTDYTKYVWTAWRGASITKSSETSTYKVSDSGTATPTGTWYNTKAAADAAYAWSVNRYMWTKTVITWSDNSTTTLYSAERNPDDGVDGMSIVIDSQSVTYSKQTSGNLDPTTLTYGAYPSSLSKGDWLYSKTTVAYKKSDGTSAGTTNSYSVSYIGTDGTNGRAITGITEHYKASANATGETTPTSTDWGTTPTPSDWGESKPYLWNYEKITYSSGTTVQRTTAGVVAMWTKDGAGIDSITNYYLATSASSGVTPSTSGWTTTVQAMTETNCYLWNYEKTTYTQGKAATTTTPHIIGHYGRDGEVVTKVNETYRYATNNTGTRPDASSSSWQTTKPTLQKGYWLYTETTIHWSNNTETVLYTSERNPNDGVAGQSIIVDGSTVMKYYVGSSSTTHPDENSSEWKDLDQVVQTQGMWLWSKSTTYYRKANSTSGSHDAGSSVQYNVSYIAEDGDTPEAARGVESVTEYYKATNSSSPMSKPTSDSGWDTDPNLSNLTNKWSETYKYLWNYEKVTYNKAPLVERTIPQILAIWTKDGNAGKGIDSITNYYLINNSSTAPSRPSTDGTGGWSTTPTPPNSSNPYLWNYEKIVWLNPSSTTYTDVQMIGHFGKDGTSSYVADIDNEMDAVQTDDKGYSVKAQSVTTTAKLYYGNTARTFKTAVSGYTSGTAKNGVTVTWNNRTTAASSDTITFAFATTAKFTTGQMDFAITLTDGTDTSVTRTVHFTVNGINGDVYNIVPSVSEIVATRDASGNYLVNGSSTYTMGCKYTKDVDGARSTYDVADDGSVDGKYYVFRALRRRSDQKWQSWSGSIVYDDTKPRYYHRFTRTGKNIDLNTFDAMEILLCANGSSQTTGWAVSDETTMNILDRELVYVVANGTDGLDGISSVFESSHSTQWALSNSATTQPSSWSNTRGVPTQSQRFLWQKDVYEYTAQEYGRNLMRGTEDLDMKGNSTTSWSLGGAYLSGSGGTVTRDTTQSLPIVGVKSSIKVVNTNTSQIGFAQGELKLHTGKIIMSCWVKGASGNKIMLQPAWNSATSQGTAIKTWTLADSNWTRIWCVGEITTEASTWRIGYVYSQTNGSTVYVTGLKVEYGDVATDWNKAPEDYNHTDIRVVESAGKDAPNLGENIINVTDEPFVITSSTPNHYNNATRWYATPFKIDGMNIPDNTPLSGQMKIKIEGCSNFNARELFIYLSQKSTGGYPRIATFTPTENGTYVVKRENFTVNSSGNGWNNSINFAWSRNNDDLSLGTDGKITIEDVKLEIGDRCTAWSLSEHDKTAVSVYLESPIVLFTQDINNTSTITPLPSKTNIIVKKGGVTVPFTDYTVAKPSSGLDDTHCTYSVTNTSTEKSVTISAIGTYAEGGKNYYYESGFARVVVTYEGSTYVLDYKFLLNAIGKFKTVIEGDVETSIASKKFYEYNPATGQYDKETTMGEFIRSSSLNESTLSERVDDKVVAMSEVLQRIDGISLKVYDEASIKDLFTHDADIVLQATTSATGVIPTTASTSDCYSYSVALPIIMRADTSSAITFRVQTKQTASGSVIASHITSISITNGVVTNATDNGRLDVVEYLKQDNKQFLKGVLSFEYTTSSAFKVVVVEARYTGTNPEATFLKTRTFNVGGVSLKKGLQATGIDIERGRIINRANQWEVWNLADQRTAWIDDMGNFTIRGVYNNLITVIDENNWDKYIIKMGSGSSAKFYLDVLKCGTFVMINYLPVSDFNAASDGMLHLPYYANDNYFTRGYTRYLDTSDATPRLMTDNELRMLAGRKMVIKWNAFTGISNNRSLGYVFRPKVYYGSSTITTSLLDSRLRDLYAGEKHCISITTSDTTVNRSPSLYVPKTFFMSFEMVKFHTSQSASDYSWGYIWMADDDSGAAAKDDIEWD